MGRVNGGWSLVVGFDGVGFGGGVSSPICCIYIVSALWSLYFVSVVAVVSNL